MVLQLDERLERPLAEVAAQIADIEVLDLWLSERWLGGGRWQRRRAVRPLRLSVTGVISLLAYSPDHQYSKA